MDLGVDRRSLPGSPSDATTVYVSRHLRRRHWVAADRAALLEIYGDADAMRWVGDGTPLSSADADRWLDVTARTYARRGYGNETWTLWLGQLPALAWVHSSRCPRG